MEEKRKKRGRGKKYEGKRGLEGGGEYPEEENSGTGEEGDDTWRRKRAGGERRES